MKLGMYLRLMGDSSQPDVVRECAQAADAAGIHDLWVPDHIAIPPDDAEGSNGRYLDPLAALAWLAGLTERIGLGTGVLILPYRPALPTAKWIATIQALSGDRMLLGVGVGWMEPEFKALGLSRRERGADTDATLDLLRRCFDAEDDIVEENGQPFLFRPHPPAPPIFVGGAPPHAFERCLRYGDGWLPMIGDPDQLAPHVKTLRAMADEAGRPMPEVATIGGLPSGDPAAGAALLHRFAEAGATRVILGGRYGTAAEYRRMVDDVVAAREELG